MKLKNYCLLLAVLSAVSSLQLQAADFTPIDSVATFIRGLQYTSGAAKGAFKKGYGVAYNADGTSKDVNNVIVPKGTPMYFVEPYFTHLSCIALLEAAKSGNRFAENIAAVEGWMNWYIERVLVYDPANYINDGTIPIYDEGKIIGYEYERALMVNYYYNADGSIEVTCPSGVEMKPTTNYCNQIDAEDSDPTLFFMLLDKYYRVTGKTGFFKEENVRLKLEGLAVFIYNKLYKPDAGLTAAKRSYVRYYTMDNSEVYAGLNAFYNIEVFVYKDPDSPSPTTKFTDDVDYFMAIAKPAIKQALITNKLYPSYNSALSVNYNYSDYKLAAGGIGGLDGACGGYLDASSMYAFTPMMWPVLFNLDENKDSDAANSARKIIDTAFPNWSKPDWILSSAANGFWDPSIGFYFSISGNPAYQAKGKEAANSALPHFMPSSEKLGKTPGIISDAGWLLMNLLQMAGKNPTVY